MAASGSSITVPGFLRSMGRSALAPHGSFELLTALYEVGAQALPVVMLVSAFVGSIITLAGFSVFTQFGRSSDVGVFVALAGVREMVPVAACFLLAAKSGAGMAALIGTMRLGNQLTALEAMAVDPMRFLALPRLAAMIIAAPLLVVFGNAIFLATGALVAIFQLHVDAGLYWDAVFRHVALYDLGVGLLKGAVFGGIIALCSLYHGFAAEASPAGVGRASNRAVVSASVICIVVNYFLTQACYRS